MVHQERNHVLAALLSDHKWTPIYQELAKRDTFIPKPKPRPARRRKPKLNHPLREYIVTLSSDEPTYILAANAEEAAWHALELSEDRDAVLIDVRLTDEW